MFAGLIFTIFGQIRENMTPQKVWKWCPREMFAVVREDSDRYFRRNFVIQTFSALYVEDIYMKFFDLRKCVHEN